MQWASDGPSTSKLNDRFILCGKHIGQLDTAVREALGEKEINLPVAIWATKCSPSGDINNLAVFCESSHSLIEPRWV
jgi:hypothetical protein